LEELFTGSDRAMSAIRRGLALSLAYNVTAVTLAACGLVTPLLAAILMPLSSLSVIALATLQRAFPGSTSDARKGRDL
jgi:cation transport ATPase